MSAAKSTVGLATLLGCLLAHSAAGAEPETAVAPGVEGTRMQMWPRAAWSEAAKCWLVAWREGDMTEQKTDIRCARVSADGRALDPKGIRVGGAQDVQDRPVVVSDGRGFLVVWEDLRSGNDWDVYAARVSGEGKLLDPDGVLVAGGEHNQCRPAAVFCKGGYLVVFQAFTAKGEGDAGTAGTGYVIRCVRVSIAGKPSGGEPPAVSDPEPKMHTWQPCAAAGGDGVLVSAYQRSFGEDYKAVILSAGWVAMPDGRPAVQMKKVHSSHPAPYEFRCYGSRTTHQPPTAAWTGKGYLVCVPRHGRANKDPDSVVVFKLDAQGKDLGNPEQVNAFGGYRRGKPNACVSLAFDGERCLLVQDSLRTKGRRGPLARLQVRGCFLSPEGRLLDGGKPFLVAGDEELKKDCMQGFAAAGSKGRFLVTWSEARGVDDVKLMARLVKGPGG